MCAAVGSYNAFSYELGKRAGSETSSVNKAIKALDFNLREDTRN